MKWSFSCTFHLSVCDTHDTPLNSQTSCNINPPPPTPGVAAVLAAPGLPGGAGGAGLEEAAPPAGGGAQGGEGGCPQAVLLL